VTAHIAPEVRGVRLSARHVPLDEWLHELAAALARYADQQERGRIALERLLG
jgi:hypothetical protein